MSNAPQNPSNPRPNAHADRRDLTGYRVVAVHAHPDDESISTGGALADLSRRGADVLVVTCTLGEEGEVIGETYQGLVDDQGRGANQLGGFRIHELARALDILGVRGEFLGGAGQYRDSGMAGSLASRNARALVNSGQRAIDDLAAVFERERPHLVLTYDPNGGYGHPDHIRAHEITHAAADQIGGLPRILWAARLRSELEAEIADVVPAGWTRPAPGELDAVDTSDTWVEMNDTVYAAKIDAMRAHATQIWIADGSTSTTNPHAAFGRAPSADVTTYALSNLIAQPVIRREHYQLGAGQPLDHGADLLSGIAL
ncbi:N-acetyl-1-D-myo-inositol-2-amino-2-deoxy-alpha-D-glucopyranoside deacetylase [Corynebacterium genitalium ATCC 33030]|uniref:1D-myo-inositol 2-acetamido-2-deoxy-alpha-D-glucopyranoside deacetylase n=1 Tax=Corynebacterium genitalium ATCC 33030 TaxID=585529 RepID=D7WDP7_9CORY|nr:MULTISPECIES: N-acetyl-1-D-myo-inositol-2-amino-2-deoxy-alpha-D-glucopyranoside deacetylase [Corynebacterium]EFK54278.1 1D-myo-inosityl-2-acetamido-2-deoxy-alpha-D-glucopyranoside deacetylase [Corynebacterium genitalium ATCC 33030]MCQ4621839.1 N-acetyl-1-D-myo-inositol-2-amino-2-deoxy-alpha-D-glucopyranoside deacetylase [Corynebacterium sp. CCUG 70398]UUA90200.1 N-acetyl-1-D-myo-inositol-2-amino-2-deoxy-alpha-D-glucopyranoside deacetylase [Corynebacterium genitalium ATCC 33030]